MPSRDGGGDSTWVLVPVTKSRFLATIGSWWQIQFQFLTPCPLPPIRQWRMVKFPAMVIVETKTFTRRIRELLDDETYRSLQTYLVRHSSAGTVIPSTGGLRKLRWPGSGRGKRGGIRIIYYWHATTDRLLMLFAFAKNESADLTAAQKKSLKQIIESEYR